MSAIVDQYGNPASVSPRLINGANGNNGNRPSMMTRTEDIKQAVPLTDWRVILSVSRRLFANNGIIQGALSQKAMHAIGPAWQPVFLGEDKAWGEEATRWLEEEWFPTCNVRGEVYDFRTSLYLSSINIDRDGDEGELLTETEDGYPQIQTVAAHRIGQRTANEKKVASGQYAGLNIDLGVITNRLGRAVAYRTLGETQEDDRDVSARDLILNFDPLYADQLRGFPIFSHALNDWRDADQSQYWEQLAQLIASSVGLIEHNETGDANDPSTQLGNSTGSSDLKTETLLGGMIRYFKAGTGSKLESFKSDRPGDIWDAFQDRITRKALGPVWPYSMAWKGGETGGTGERNIVEYARELVSDRQQLLLPRAKRKVGYAVSKGMKIGHLLPYKGSDRGGFLKWGFTMPAEMSVDKGRDGQADREDYKLGRTLMADHLSKSGAQLTVSEHWEARAMEQALKQIAIKKVEAMTGEKIDPREVQMFTPNDQSQEQNGQPTKEKP